MVETKQATTVGGQQWDELVAAALAAGGIKGTVTLGGSPKPVSIPSGFPALMTSLLQFMAPDYPPHVSVYAWVRDVGCLLEVREGRELPFLPDPLNEMAAQLGVTLNFLSLPKSSAVLVTLPSKFGAK
jgi:hypothetical protein